MGSATVGAGVGTAAVAETDSEQERALHIRVRRQDTRDAWGVIGALLAHGTIPLPDQMTSAWLDDLSVAVIVVAQQLAQLR